MTQMIREFKKNFLFSLTTRLHHLRQWVAVILTHFPPDPGQDLMFSVLIKLPLVGRASFCHGE